LSRASELPLRGTLFQIEGKLRWDKSTKPSLMAMGRRRREEG
jgi:hypothetical protein